MAFPADPNDRSLLSSIFISSDEMAHDKARDVLQRFGIPDPQEHEYFSGNNADRLYLNKQGLVISFTYRRPTLGGMISSLFGRKAAVAAPVFEARTVVDERILQPLYQEDLSPLCCLEINPGILQIGAEPENVKQLVKDLKQSRVNFYDPKQEFVGLIRTPSDEEDLLVVSNRRAIKTLSADDAGSGEALIQDRTFGSLREQMQEAFQSATVTAMGKAMAECAKIVALRADDSARILNPHWKDDTGPDSERRRAIRESAFQLHRRLTQ